MIRRILQKAKDQFLEYYSGKLFETCNPQIELIDPPLIYNRINQIFGRKGKDIYTLMSLNERGGIGSAVTLLYPDEAYILIKSIPKESELYYKGAVYTELARMYVTLNCGVKRKDILQFTYNENGITGYGFWIEYSTKLVSYGLLSEEFPKIKALCLDPKYIDANFALLEPIKMNQLTGYVSLADLYAVIMLQYGLKENNNEYELLLFPIDTSYILGKKLSDSSKAILDILMEQSKKDQPFNITEKMIINIGVELRKFDDFLTDYRAALGA